VNKFESSYGLSPWPTRLGYFANCSALNSNFSLKGKNLWQLPKENRLTRSMITGEGGQILIASDDSLVCIQPDGKIAWIDASNSRYSSFIATAGAQFIGIERGAKVLVKRDASTGSVKWSQHINTGYLLDIGITPNMDIIFIHAIADRGTSISSLGDVCWEKLLQNSHPIPPLIVNNVIIVAEKTNLKAFDVNGNFLWKASMKGFVFDETVVDFPAGLHITSPLLFVEDHKFLVGLTSNEIDGFFIFDFEKYTLERLPISQHVERKMPLTIARSGDPNGFLVSSSTVKESLNIWRSKIIAIDLKGEIMWEQDVPTKPSRILSDRSGNILVVSSPSLDRWEKYGEAYNLIQDCYVKGLNAKGREIFHWQAPGPIIDLTIGSNGELIVAMTDQIVAIG